MPRLLSVLWQMRLQVNDKKKKVEGIGPYILLCTVPKELPAELGCSFAILL
jgi:hypothetical protein